jgi:hypothetical protein
MCLNANIGASPVLFFPTVLTFARQDIKAIIFLPHVNMFKYLVFVNQITPTWRMYQFMSSIIPSFIQHRIPKFLLSYNWINKLSKTIWWLDICRLLHRYQLHVSALMAIFRLMDWQQICKQLYFGMRFVYAGGGLGLDGGTRSRVC